MLGTCRDDVTAAFAVVLSDAEDRQVVGLGSAGSPDDFVHGGTHGRRDLRPRRFDQRGRNIAIAVTRRCGIAEFGFGTQDLGHARRHSGLDRCGRGMIQVHRHSRCAHLRERCAD
jgi:hypothetical protein